MSHRRLGAHAHSDRTQKASVFAWVELTFDDPVEGLSRRSKPPKISAKDPARSLLVLGVRLHRGGAKFIGGLDLRSTLWQHFELLQPPQQTAFATRMAQAERIMALADADHPQAVPSHRDPVLGNLLLDERRLWLIDWEYSAMASPYWDLAILCNEAGLDLAQSRRLLQAYCVGGPAMQESMLFDYRGLLKLLNDCWMSAFVDS